MNGFLGKVEGYSRSSNWGQVVCRLSSEYEYEGMCKSRADAGYNSGMGEIFRRVAMISPIPVGVVVKAS